MDTRPLQAQDSSIYFPIHHLPFSVPLLAVLRQMLHKEIGGEQMLVHPTAETS